MNISADSELLGFHTSSMVHYSKISREHWTTEKVQKPSNSECYTPPAKHFRISVDVLKVLVGINLIIQVRNCVGFSISVVFSVFIFMQLPETT
jgi:hypothetical protein